VPNRHDDLAAQLVRLLDVRLLNPLEILLGDALTPVRDLVARRADTWAYELHHGTDDGAARLAMRIVAVLYPADTAFDPPADWWATPFGQVVARRVGHPTTEGLSYAAAGAMLGITRQGVHDLVRRGKLARHPDGGVCATSVRDRLRTKDQP
jgi:hypothetical protein